MTRRLVVDTIPDDFRPDTHLALGPWCFLGREALVPGWDELDFVDPYVDTDRRAQASEASLQAANALLDALRPELERRFGETHSRAFWHTVLMDWLVHVTMLTWRLWDHVAAFVERHGEEPLEVTIRPLEGTIAMATTWDVINATFYPGPFRDWLLHEIVHLQAPPAWTLLFGEPISIPAVAVPEVPAIGRWRAVDSINGMSRAWRTVFSVLTRLVPLRPPRPRPEHGAAVPPPMPPALGALLCRVSRQTLPLIVTEQFAELRKAAGVGRFRPGRLTIRSLNWHDDVEAMRTAAAAEAGERIAVVQHGGTYGWARIMSVAAEMDYSHDAFLTWGWSAHDAYRGRFVPLPHPMVGRQTGRHRPVEDTMILVGAAMYGINPRIDNYPGALPYRRSKLDFLAALPEDLRRRLAYRPYVAPGSFDDLDHLRRTYPELAAVEGDLWGRLLRCRLVVQDHHSTTLSISLGANIPTVGFWREEDWPLGEDAQAPFDGLKRAGIVFDDPAAAAAHIAEIWPNVEQWWASREVQDARHAWAERFGRGRRAWWLHWLGRIATL